MRRMSPADARLPTAPVEALRGGDAGFNAKALRRPATRRARSLPRRCSPQRRRCADRRRRSRRLAPKRVEEAAEVIDKGLANALLNCWIAALK